MINVIPIPAFRDNYIWAIVHVDAGRCILVDPGDAKPALAWLEQSQLELEAIIITHHHRDHTGGIKALTQAFNTPVYGPSDIADVTHTATDNDSVNLLGLTFDVIAIPGHTLDHIAYIGHGLLFCGDTLFSAGCGRVFEGTHKQMLTSLNKLKQLPDDTKVYCAHEYTQNNLLFAKTLEPNNTFLLKRLEQVLALRKAEQSTLPSTIKAEKQINPFLRCNENAIKLAAEKQTTKTLTTEESVFAAIRQLKDNY